MPRSPRPTAQKLVVPAPTEQEVCSCCPFQSAIDLLSKKHALTIVWYLQRQGTARFNDIRRSLAVNPVSLTQRLTELEEAGVISRKAFKETPPRVEYTLTSKGNELVPLIDQLDEWARKHDGSPAPRPSAPRTVAAK